MVQPRPSPAAADDFPADDTEQRRGYGAIDMQVDACVVRETDYILRGKACEAGIRIFGPYVSVPSNAQVEVSFDVQSDSAVQVYGDLVSGMGKQVLAGLNPQVVAPDQSQKLGYFVSFAKADTNVESRIGFRSDDSVNFVISNLTMTVR